MKTLKDVMNQDLTGKTYNDTIEVRSESITSLEGSPKLVTGEFIISHNSLKSLQYGPELVGTNFFCAGNRLTTLEHMPKGVGVSIDVSGNPLESLEHMPEKVKGDFSCSNTKITSLKHCPTEIGRSFYCYGTKIKDPLKEVFEHRVRAKSYDFGDDTIYFRDIEKEFNSYVPLEKRVTRTSMRTLLGLDK